MLTSKPNMTIDGKHGQITAELHRTRTEVIPKLKEELAEIQASLAKDDDDDAEKKQRFKRSTAANTKENQVPSSKRTRLFTY